jgi:ribosomal protein L32
MHTGIASELFAYGNTPACRGIALIDAIATGKDHGYRTLYPLNSAGEPDASQAGTLVPLGLAVYVAGAGAGVAMLGGFIMRQSPSGDAATPPAALKTCPDCAETVRAAANVCKHCGYRFAQ